MERETAFRIWCKIALFFALAMLFSSVFWVLTPKNSGDQLMLITGLMYCPALAAFAVKALYKENIRDLGWQWGKGKYQLWSYLIPLLYSLPVYLLAWSGGFGHFHYSAHVKIRQMLGLSGGSPAVILALYFLLNASFGMVAKVSRGLGEEIGWRGFLVPELYKVTGFTGTSVISGLMWAAWHYPMIIFSNYHGSTPLLYSLGCFTVLAVASSFLMAWLRLRSGSLWTGAVFHGSHNLFIQSIFTPLTEDNGITGYLTDEFGIGMALSSALFAVLWCKYLPFGKTADGKERPVTGSSIPAGAATAGRQA